MPEDIFDDDEVEARLDACEDEGDVRVSSVVSKVGDTFTFLYEKGTWAHQIVVEEVRVEELNPEGGCGHDHAEGEEHDHEHDHDHENESKYPHCVGGARACPPELIGGPAGYQVCIFFGDSSLQAAVSAHICIIRNS